ncbi:electron transport complex subunit RsxB [Pusillimonas sp. MFBS29]|uniref:electron transport complex subunit RsxB n=1 Tax=Pusillimonas sp. MFBS29 TaxID=2886690 RepID=UPI001D114113|nr:electron transport complex subunit RsxB [Pusillimonas sp. MFBS29]MCC2595126.1 electron transport complex subunit RsxB [Pusillimonas sp. MFBS29]
MPSSLLIDRIDAVLPQTQCTKCGYDGCRPYARAMALEDAPINRCPPGGQPGIQALAKLLGRPESGLDSSCGEHRPLQVAVIDEAHCIGCTLCIQACPVDAIVGANKLMHTVLAADCTGCDLCVAPCPVDCIVMVDAGREWTSQDADTARMRYEQRQRRLQAQHSELSGLAARTLANKAPVAALANTDSTTRQAVIAQALERARARRQKT